MGGFGSGGSRSRGRPTTSGSCELSTAFLRKQGALRQGARAYGTSHWSAGEEKVASIAWRTDTTEFPHLTLSYRHTPYGGPPADVEERFSLVPVSMRFGGVRWWIRCCRCWRRVGSLYKPPGTHLFRCRRCFRLSYASQNETPEWRAYRRAVKCEARISKEAAKARVPADFWDAYFPPRRPKGMRWRRYETLVQQAEQHASTFRGHSAETLDRILSRPVVRGGS